MQELKPEAVEKPAQRLIRLRNVAPSLMAWWLDPAHQEKPLVYKPYRSSGVGSMAEPRIVVESLSALNDRKKLLVLLPAGIERIVAIDPQNALLVFGTEAGFKKLESIVSLLDKPLRRFAIETQFVEINDENLKLMDLDFSGSATPLVYAPKAAHALQQAPNFRMGAVRGSFQGQLSALLAKSKAKVLSMSRLAAISNQLTSLTVTYSQLATLTAKDEKGKNTELLNGVDKDELSLLLGREFKLSVTPTINSDDTVNLFLTSNLSLVLTGGIIYEPLVLTTGGFQQELELRKQRYRKSLVLKELASLQTNANVKDGDTVALTGLNTSMFSTQVKSKIPPSNVILFVTTHIVPRPGDEDMVPGT